MGLQGDLTSFDAADVLRLLSWTKKSGTLDLSGDRGHGLVRVLNGKVVGGEVDHARTSADAEVVYELLRFRIGTFLFEEGEPRSEHKPASVDDVLAGAATLLSEWKAIESVVPDFDRSIRLRPDIAGDEVHLSVDEWKAIVALGGGATVRQLGDRLVVSDLAVGGTVKGLVERGMVALEEPVAAADVDEDVDHDADDTADDRAGRADQQVVVVAVADADVADESAEPSIGGLRAHALASTSDIDRSDEPANEDGVDRGDGGDDGDRGEGAEAGEDVSPGKPLGGQPSGIRLDYEPGFDAVPAPRRPNAATGGSVWTRPAAEPTQPVASAREAVESGRATDRRPHVDLSSVVTPPTTTPPPPPPAPPSTTESGASWQPAWAPTAGLDIPTVGATVEGDEDLSGRKKGRRRFRRA